MSDLGVIELLLVASTSVTVAKTIMRTLIPPINDISNRPVEPPARPGA